jgi:sterol desaturase/sphingolipid hydroxylase (fatty acid hydroxylase superfamily)
LAKRSADSDELKSIDEWYFPFFGSKPGRSSYHGVFTFINLNVASLCAMYTTEMSVRGLNGMRFTPLSEYGVGNMLIDLAVAVVFENIVEYYWHVLMHTRVCYNWFHKHHHYYKAPQPFDDMMIHPLEGFGYYCILYAPPFVLAQMHIVAYVLYMIIMGICGVLDHSGVKFSISVPLGPWRLPIYNTVDHDLHHEKFNVNYAFPSPYMDYLHGTHYHGDKFLPRQSSTGVLLSDVDVATEGESSSASAAVDTARSPDRRTQPHSRSRRKQSQQ